MTSDKHTPGILEALKQCERAIDGSLRGAGQSTAGWMAGRRQMANAVTAARAAIAEATDIPEVEATAASITGTANDLEAIWQD